MIAGTAALGWTGMVGYREGSVIGGVKVARVRRAAWWWVDVG